MNLSAAPLPISALVGLEPARRALLLLAVNPRLGGCVLAAGAGTGKSSLARGFAALLPENAPFVELPVGVSEDRLLGGLDLETTLATGRRAHRSGVLAEAHGGVLNVDGLNLLDSTLGNHLLAALDSGEVRVEREGLSLREPARFVLLGTYDPAEGAPRRHLLDRIGLIVAPIARADAAHRAEVVRRNRAWHAGRPPALREQWEQEDALLQGIVGYARELLPGVRLDDEQIERLVATALALGVEGHRADYFAAQCALAAAALADRDRVLDEDLEEAVRFVLLPRATRMPQPPQEDEPPPPPEPEQNEQQNQDEDDEQDEQPPEPDEPRAVEDLIFDALDSEMPPDILETPFSVQRKGKSGSRGQSLDRRRGRHVRSLSGGPRDGRLDIVATLRAAAPWQRIRGRQAMDGEQGAGRRVLLRGDDLQVKRFKNKAGTLFCFAVDASGSMALHRMRQAKGAVNALLQQAYIHRDQVALLAFRGQTAELLLPPSQSVELAKRALDVLPTGGGTPIAAALLAALNVAQQAHGRGVRNVTLVLITDGRPNVPLKPEAGENKDAALQRAREEVRRLAAALRAEGIGAVVVDTQRSYLSRGEASQLAAWLGGRYVYLPNARGDQIAAAVAAEQDN
jgi:magnesium chelatase subunit D